MYDHGYPGDRTTEQDIEDQKRHKKQLEQQKQLQVKKDYFSVILYVNGRERKIKNLNFQEALEKTRENPGSKIIKEQKGR